MAIANATFVARCQLLLPPANICFNTYAQMSLQGAIFMLLDAMLLPLQVAAVTAVVAVAVVVHIYYAPHEQHVAKTCICCLKHFAG